MYIIAGFPGVGKSHLRATSQSMGFFDLEPTPYRTDPQWPQNYLLRIEELMDEGLYVYILISTHPEVVGELLQRGYPVNLFYPDGSQKEDYVMRYRQRGNSETGVQMLADMFESNVANLRAIAHPNCTHVVLQPGQYLSDVLAL